MTPDEIRRSLTEFINALSQDDWTSALEIFGRSASDEDVEQFRREHAQFREAFPDWRATIEELVVEGNKAVVWSTMRATHVGEFPVGELKGVPPSGRTAEWEEVMFIEYDDAGQAVSGRWILDGLGRLRQLQDGAAPV